MTSAEILNLPDGTEVPWIEGEITNVYDRKTGENAYGPWSFQNATLRDSTGTVTLQLKDIDELSKQHRGAHVVLRANSTQHGARGLKAIDDNVKGKTVRKLRVTSAADFDFGGAPASAPPPQQPPPRTDYAPDWDDPPKPRPQQSGPPPKADESDEDAKAYREARRTIMQIANLHALCAQAVNGYEAGRIKASTGVDMSESQRQGATASIFIEACKSGLVRSMPAHPVSDS